MLRLIAMMMVGITGLLVMPVSSVVADPKGKKIALCISNVAQAYIATLAKSVTDASKRFGMEVSTFSSPFDAALQAQQMDDAIARKYDMIILVAVSEQAVVPAATRAHQVGIPMLTLIQPPKSGTENFYLANIGEDQPGLGRIAGEQLVAAFKASGRDGGKVAAITGALQEGTAPLRLNAFKEAIKANPRIELAAVEDAKWDTARSRQIASQLLARFAGQGGLQAIYVACWRLPTGRRRGRSVEPGRPGHRGDQDRRCDRHARRARAHRRRGLDGRPAGNVAQAERSARAERSRDAVTVRIPRRAARSLPAVHGPARCSPHSNRHSTSTRCATTAPH